MDTVLIDGVVRKRGGVLVGVDLPSLLARLDRSSAKLAKDFSTVDLNPIEAFWN